MVAMPFETVLSAQALVIALAPLRSMEACKLVPPADAELSNNEPVPKASLLPIMVVEVEPRVVVPP